MISIHYTTLMHCNQKTNSTRHLTPHNKANRRKIAFRTRHSTTQRNQITWQTLCRRWTRASSTRRRARTLRRIIQNPRRVWIRLSFIAMMIIKWIIMIPVTMTYWHHIIIITIKRKTIERVKRQRDNPTFHSNLFRITILISLLQSFSLALPSWSSINELYDNEINFSWDGGRRGWSWGGDGK